MSAPIEAQKFINSLGLEAHPEGGYFKRWYESDLLSKLPVDGRWSATDERKICTSIYYLLVKGEKSSLHKLKSDELYFWHAGHALCVVELDEKSVQQTLVGPDVTGGHQLSHCVRAGKTFGSYLPEGSDWALVSCVVAPGFDFADWEMHTKAELLTLFPHGADYIHKLATDA